MTNVKDRRDDPFVYSLHKFSSNAKQATDATGKSYTQPQKCKKNKKWCRSLRCVLCVRCVRCVALRRVHNDVTELNWRGLVFDELTNGQARRAYWSSVDALTRTWAYLRSPPTPLDGAYCNALLLAHWLVRQKLNHVSSVQFSLVTPLCARL